MNWIYPVTIIFYSLSVFGYFIDFIQNNRKANRLAFWLLSVVWGLQTIFFVYRAIELGRLPLITPFEGLFFYAWAVVTLSLIINRFHRVDFLVFFLNIVGFSMMAFSLFSPDGDIPAALNALLASELMIIHVGFILLSYVAFTLAFAFSMMYALQHHLLKQKEWGKRLLRLGSLSKLDRFAYWSTMTGVPFLMIGLILGFVWAVHQLGIIPILDSKVLGSLLTLLIYISYLYERTVKKRRGYNMSLLNIAGFLMLLINYFLSGNFSSFHLWYIN